MPYQQKISNWFEQPRPHEQPPAAGNYYAGWVLLDEHAGTHCDPPSHWVPPLSSSLPRANKYGSIGVDQLEFQSLTGRARVIRVDHLIDTSGPGISPEIGLNEIERHEAEHGAIQAGDAVLFASGWDTRYVTGPAGSRWATDVATGSIPGWPAPTAITIEALHARGVTLVGTDGVSMGAAENGDAAHYAGLSRGMVFVEALCNLRDIPEVGAYFMFLPVKLVGASGGPGRAVAIVVD